MKLKEIGWNGFLMTVPEEMYLIRQGGNANQGTFSLESEECLVEFNWKPISKKKEPLISVVESIIERAKKEADKKKQKLSIKSKKATMVNNHDAMYLRMKSIAEECYYIWYCQESNRLVIVRFILETLDDKSRKFIKRFLAALKCHAEERYVWALMKMRFEAPKTFLLSEMKMEVGRAHILLVESNLSVFEERRRTINLDYFSMANLRFKDTYKDPEKWFEKNYMKAFKKILRKRKVHFNASGKKELNGHKAVIKQVKTASGFYMRSAILCSTACWYCSETNRIYILTVNSRTTRPIFLKRRLEKKEHDALFDEVLASFQCH